MIIKSLSNSELFINYLPLDSNGRKVDIFLLKDVQPVGDTYYPNTLFKNYNGVFKPMNERIMSLEDIQDNSEKDNSGFEVSKISKIEKNPVFFFVYNTDNYYHFIYDTLPYIMSYLFLKNFIPNIKLLMNYPNSSKLEFYKFVQEFLELLDIREDDILIIKNDTIYDGVYISSSYTHGEDSNVPPREEIYDFFKKIASIASKKSGSLIKYPKNIYISRRTWINDNLSNIGTNYTTRRKLINEDDLVRILSERGYDEIFTENLSTIDKIKLFSNAESIIGSIGGGLCNVLFSKDAKLLVLVSPTFLDVNSRFKYSFKNIKTEYFFDSEHIEKGDWKKYMRVKTIDNIIGEIEEVYDESLLISYTNKFVAGWNSQVNFEKKIVNKNDCYPLDNGLNSPWKINMDKLKNKI